jgi:hypothetical protein
MSETEPLDEREIERLENLFPAAASGAFRNAYHQALRAGFSVLVSANGAIYEVFPDGHRRFVKAIDPPIVMRPGQKFTIR